MPWRTFVQAHWPALVAADFFTTEVWTTRGLVTYYTAFVIELQSRRVQVIGSTPYPDEAFVIQCLRQMTSETDGLLREGRILICDRDPKWSGAVEAVARHGGRSRRPDAAACAELQCVCGAIRPIREGGVPESGRPARRMAPASDPHENSSTHYHGERNHQGLAQRADRRSGRATDDRRRSSPSASRRDSQLLLPVSRVGRGGSKCGTERVRPADALEIVALALSAVTASPGRGGR